MYDKVEIDRDDVYEILGDCDMFEIMHSYYGKIDVMEESEIVESFTSELISLINDKLGENKIIYV